MTNDNYDTDKWEFLFETIPDFLNKFYNENKDKHDCIVGKEFIVKKSNEIFYNGVWKNPSLNKGKLLDVNNLLFGFKSGIFISTHGVEFICSKDEYDTFGISFDSFFEFNSLEDYLEKGYVKIENGRVTKIKKTLSISLDEEELINKLLKSWMDLLNNYKLEIEKNKKVEFEKYQESLNTQKTSIISELDKDENGEVDLIDGESFNKLLTKNQKSIIEIDKNYIQKFVKISMYLKTKKSNIQNIFDSIKDTKNDTELNELINLLKNQIHTYELLVFHSINMITSLVESDLITFYEIYECFDQSGVFNSNWENEVSNKLTDIGDGIKNLMYSIYQMENKIVNSIDNLTYVTQDSFKKLNISVNNQLSSIDSSINFNNLLTGIQTYQMYKINQKTKRIN